MFFPEKSVRWTLAIAALASGDQLAFYRAGIFLSPDPDIHSSVDWLSPGLVEPGHPSRGSAMDSAT